MPNCYNLKKSLPIGVLYLIVAALAYTAIKPLLKSFLFDSLNLSPHIVLHTLEAPVLLILITVFMVLYIHFVVYKTLPVYSISISNNINDKQLGYNHSTINKAFDKILEDWAIETQPQYNDIPFRNKKTVYTIVGNWRAGKTTAAGYLIQKIRENSNFDIRGEYYHDTFNFGNIDESIGVFFDEIARMTEINEFERLGKVSTPGLDIKLSIGPIGITPPQITPTNVNTIRKSIYDKLREKYGCYIIVIDDIDRLTKDEQVQWLRTIELLGKFESKIIVIVPVNETVLEINAESNLISKKYIDKILPHKIKIGLDIDFVRGLFLKHDMNNDITKKRYAKYLFALAIRISIIEHRIKEWDFNSWQLAFDAGEISGIARVLSHSLTYSEIGTSDYGSPLWGGRYGKEKDILLSDLEDMQIIMSISNNRNYQYQNFAGTEFARNKFSGDSIHSSGQQETYEQYTRRSLNTLTNYSNLRGLFSDIHYKNTTATYDTKFDHIKGASPNSYWLQIAYPTIEDISGDTALKRYFTYEIIEKEIEELFSVTPEDEADFFANLIRQGDLAI